VSLRTGSLWEKSERRPVPGLDRIVVRPPTPEEFELLRRAAEKAERESPFRDDVCPELLDLVLD
jgi:hypothetical protein